MNYDLPMGYKIVIHFIKIFVLQMTYKNQQYSKHSQIIRLNVHNTKDKKSQVYHKKHVCETEILVRIAKSMYNMAPILKSYIIIF